MHHTPHEPDFLHSLRRELGNGRLWFDRAMVLANGVAAGLSVAAFTRLGEWGLGLFERLYGLSRWAILLWPAAAASRRPGQGAENSPNRNLADRAPMRARCAAGLLFNL